MKIKEIIEMSTDELADEEARLAPGKLASAFAAAERPARTTKPVAFAAPRRGADRNGALATRETKLKRSNLWPNETRTRNRRRVAVVSRASRKTRTGEVISSGMNKTIVVRTVTRVPHPKFGKIVKQMKKFYAHDEGEQGKDR